MKMTKTFKMGNKQATIRYVVDELKITKVYLYYFDADADLFRKIEMASLDDAYEFALVMLTES